MTYEEKIGVLDYLLGHLSAQWNQEKTSGNKEKIMKKINNLLDQRNCITQQMELSYN